MKRVTKQLGMFAEDEVLPLWTETALPVSAEVLSRCRVAAELVVSSLLRVEADPVLVDAPDKVGGEEGDTTNSSQTGDNS